MEKKQWKDLSKTEKWVGSISLVVFVILIISFFGGSDSSSSSQNNSKEEREEINLEITKNGYGDIFVRVLNDIDWSDCHYEINGKFKLNGSYKLFSQKTLTADGVDGQSIATRLFTDKDGLKFNPDIYEVNVFSGSCQEPYYSFFYYEK